MSQSSNRAQADATAASRRYYKWDAGKPVTVRIAFDVIERLERIAVENFRSLTARGSEIGGILIGEVASGSGTLVRVDDFEQIECDYSRGPLYRLSDSDTARLEDAIGRRGPAGSAGVVGFFRSHTRKGLSLDECDLSLLHSRFGGPGQIALLVRPFATKASTAGIFIREDGEIRAESSHLEFPFQTSQLTPAAPDSADVNPGMPSIPAPVVKPVTRARVISMASRAEAIEPGPAPEPAPVAPPAPEPVQVETKASEQPALKQPDPPESARGAQHDDHPPSASAPFSAGIEETDAPGSLSGKLKNKWIWGAAAAAVLLCSGALFIYPGMIKRTSHPMVPLTLRIERTAGDLLLTWNRESDAIKNAESALLSISDGERQENYQMDLTQLRTGSIVYSPLTPDVSFRLDVNGPQQARIASEMVRVLRTRPSPMPQQQAAAGSPAPAAAAAQVPVTAPVQNVPEQAVEPEAAPVKRPAPRPFNVASLAQRLRPATSSDVPLPMPLATSSSPAPSVNIGAITATQMAVPAPAGAASPQAAASDIRRPQLVSRVNPEYPVLARQRNISGVVKVAATIGVDGKVKAVRVISGNPLLQGAAAAAVKQWVYTPMMLNGKPTQSEQDIDVNFTLGR